VPAHQPNTRAEAWPASDVVMLPGLADRLLHPHLAGARLRDSRREPFGNSATGPDMRFCPLWNRRLSVMILAFGYLIPSQATAAARIWRRLIGPCWPACRGCCRGCGGQRLCHPATLLRWHRNLVAWNWTTRRGGRAVRRSRPGCGSLVLRLARDNPSWGCRRIHGKRAGRGYRLAPSTIWSIVTKAGVGPVPRRSGSTWTEFLTAGQRRPLLRLPARGHDLPDPHLRAVPDGGQASAGIPAGRHDEPDRRVGGAAGPQSHAGAGGAGLAGS
jgi:hypothetical protein